MRTIITRLAALGLLGICVWVVLRADDPPRLPHDEEVEKLIEQLGSDDFATREAATKTLDAMGGRPLPYLRLAVRHNDREIRWRAEHILARPQRTSEATGLTLLLVKRGELTLGSNEVEVGRRPDEFAHLVRISQPFYLGKYEVSQAEYRQIMKTSPSWFSPTGKGIEKVATFDTANFPVEQVSWFDALVFCNELSKADRLDPYYELTDIKRQDESITSAVVKVRGGPGYRLPTEAEWEYACRAGTTTPFHYGAERNGRASNVRGASMRGGYGADIRGLNLQRTCARGSYPANEWGLCDMHGNLGEWCWDVYERDYYQTSPRVDPAGPAAGDHRTLRGGNWLLDEASCRSAARNFASPSDRKEFLGFRVARNP